jgi:tight adherence protein B
MEVAATTIFALAAIVSLFLHQNAGYFRSRYNSLRKQLMEEAGKREHHFLTPGKKKGLEFKLYRLGYNISAAHFLAAAGILSLVGGALAAWTMENWLLFMVVPGALFLFIITRVQMAYQGRKTRMDEQAELVLQIIAGLYKSNGKDMIRAIKDVLPSTKPPMKDELDRVVMDYNLGRPLNQCLRELAEKADNPDIEVFVDGVVMAEVFGRETEHVVESTAEIIRKRIELREDLRNETTMQRWIIYIFLLALPAAFSTLWMYYPPARETLTQTNLGKGLMAAVVCVEFGAWYLSRKRGLVDNL